MTAIVHKKLVNKKSITSSITSSIKTSNINVSESVTLSLVLPDVQMDLTHFLKLIIHISYKKRLEKIIIHFI